MAKSTARAEWNISSDDMLITTTGRMTPQKGFDDLIRAFPSILHSVPRSKLLLVGDGYLKGQLEGLARSEGVSDRTIFAGFVSDQRLLSALKSSDVVVIPSRFEPFGITALEAMAGGIPLVVSSVGGLAEIVEDNVDGIWVNPGDPGSIADGVVRLLTNSSMASRLAAKAKEKVKRYNWATVAEETVGVYETAIRDVRYG
jgi:glycosyltransferase involved in cell wall biosynthesis